MGLCDLKCSEFIDVLAGSKPVPGGGGASALAGAVGAALGNMVGSLTYGKKKYERVRDDIIRLNGKAEKLRSELFGLVEKDAEVFAPLAEAYSMPDGTPEEKELKETTMEECLRGACSVPLEIMRKCCEAIDMQKEFAEKGSRLAVSDAGTGAVLCKAALQGASLNVFINTRAMTDRNYAQKINEKAEAMLQTYAVRADDIFNTVRTQLR